MKRVTPAKIEAAKKMDLLSYMQCYEPEELVRVGPHDFKTKTHGSLCISDNGFWHWTSRGFGGRTALKYLTEVKLLPFPEAVRLLNEGRLVESSFQHVSVALPEQPAEARKLQLPEKDAQPTEMLAYLRKRGISDKILQDCMEKGILYQSTHKGNANCVFVGLDESGTPRAACVRGCTGHFRGEVTGSQKKFSFHVSAIYPDCKLLEIYEAPIDALSGATLRQYSGRDWRSVSYLSLGGLNYLALDHYLTAHPKITTLRICLDNDAPGRAFTDKLMEKYQVRGYTVEDRPARVGKDYNDALVAYCERHKEKHSEQMQEERKSYENHCNRKSKGWCR